jgi:acyl transferase domain-containing protein
MQERMGFVASSIEEVIEKLTLFVLADGSAVTGIHRGARAHRTTEVRPEVTPDGPEGPDRLLAAWVNGAEVHWHEDHGRPGRRRVRLPGYAFDRKRFWFGEEQKELRLAAAAAAGAGSVRPVVSLREIGPPPREVSLPAAESSVTDSGSPERASSLRTSADFIADVLAGMLAEVLYMNSEDISRDAAFIDLGLDSVIGVEWIKLVNRHFGVKLSATKIYDHPDVSAFARYLGGALGAGLKAAPPPSLDEVLEQVQRGSLTVEEAETLIGNLGLAG